jgi:hypothetical protein
MKAVSETLTGMGWRSSTCRLVGRQFCRSYAFLAPASKTAAVDLGRYDAIHAAASNTRLSPLRPLERNSLVCVVAPRRGRQPGRCPSSLYA